MAIRLKSFDYKSPYFYMVTIKRLEGFEPFCEITRASESEIARIAAEAAKGTTLYRREMKAEAAICEKATLPTSERFYLVETAITAAFRSTIAAFAAKWSAVEKIEPFAIMPDHIHLMIKLADWEKQAAAGFKPVALGVVVSQLIKALTRAYWEVVDKRVIIAAERALQEAAQSVPQESASADSRKTRRQTPENLRASVSPSSPC